MVLPVRSPSRPNPLSLTIVQREEVREEPILGVSFLGLIDGTPVLDLNPYQSGTDSVFSTRDLDHSGRIRKLPIERSAMISAGRLSDSTENILREMQLR